MATTSRSERTADGGQSRFFIGGFTRRVVKVRADDAATVNDQRNRAARLRVDFRFRRIRRSGSRNCSAALLRPFRARTSSRLRIATPVRSQ